MNRLLWGVMTLLSIMVAGYAFASMVGFRNDFVQNLFATKATLGFMHLGGGGIALAVGGFQFSRSLRRRRLALHRLLGRVYVIAVLVGGSAGALLGSTTVGGLPARTGFTMLGALWLISTLAAFARVRGGDLRAHQIWMIRSFALCLAAVTLRIYLPIGEVLGYGFDQSYPAIAWLCWVPNLVVAEWLVVARRSAG